MLRKLFFLLSVIIAFTAQGQDVRQNPAPSKTTEKQSDPEIDYKQPGAPLPPFRLIICRDSLDKRSKTKEVITNDDLDDKGNLFVMIFNPTCSHCQEETARLEKNIDLFKRSRLILSATPEMKQYVSDFLKLMHIDDYPQITVGIDSARYMNNVFKYQMLPQINIYNKKHKLVKIYTGEVAIDSLKEYIQ